MAQDDEQKDQIHEPVLLDAVIQWLRPQQGGTFIDCTLGLGGHAEAMLRASPDVRVIGIDRDAEAIRLAERRLKIFEGRFHAAHANFTDLLTVMSREGINEAQGILADLGVSSLQFDRAERGFSFAEDAPLDMRMDRKSGETAADLVNNLSERELADLIFEYGEERGSRPIARAIVRERSREPITTTKRLSDIVVRALHVPGRWRIHPATRTFQALRIAVNDELLALDRFIPDAVSALARGGRLAIISFHSLEDRVVKRSFLRESGRCICQLDAKEQAIQKIRAEMAQQTSYDANNADRIICNRCGARRRVEVLTRKPTRPTEEEVRRNPRSRSALLRVCEKI
ncbi:MAG TPA: 16S rRNA (cytosine(1402)-N(4))-methyltransferase RsmH [Blastocatellia bacterium]|nr:16S rRNA (cytosine(1402)-N(4))-methyltransferase RsmH [Blastocatellia bacterium]